MKKTLFRCKHLLKHFFFNLTQIEKFVLRKKAHIISLTEYYNINTSKNKINVITPDIQFELC